MRSEILDKVKQLGKEVGKRLEQFGYAMNWGDVGKADIDHPLIEMVCYKIAYSEKKYGSQPNLRSNVKDLARYIWPKYFRTNKKSQLDPKYLLDWTWYRPRDFVRLMNICREIDGSSEEFSEKLINRGNKRYSERSWSEIAAQMSLYIDPFSMDGIEKLMTRFKREFVLDEFELRLVDLSETLTPAERLRRKYKPADVLGLLYKCGAVGNIYGSRMRFVFRGDPEPDFEGKFYVHRGLLPHFSISIRKS